MPKLGRTLIVMATAALAAVPTAPAFADDNPCKGTAPGPHCRPPCTTRPVIEPGDPVNGYGPYVYFEQTGC